MNMIWIMTNKSHAEDADTEGCGVYREFDQGGHVMGMLSLRPAKISGIKGSHYLPGNVEAILKIIHNRSMSQTI